ncbi:MAG: hypothetical protein AAF280_08740 [Pseudomonadota bacterium]
MIRSLALILALSATPAAAEFVIEKDSYFVIHRDYHHETNTYTDGAPKGEEDACFQITKVDLNRKQIDFVLISGHYAPWWMDGEVIQPGAQDAYVPAIGFTENNPDADWTEMLHNTLKTVPAC